MWSQYQIVTCLGKGMAKCDFKRQVPSSYLLTTAFLPPRPRKRTRNKSHSPGCFWIRQMGKQGNVWNLLYLKTVVLTGGSVSPGNIWWLGETLLPVTARGGEGKGVLWASSEQRGCNAQDGPHTAGTSQPSISRVPRLRKFALNTPSPYLCSAPHLRLRWPTEDRTCTQLVAVFSSAKRI